MKLPLWAAALAVAVIAGVCGALLTYALLSSRITERAVGDYINRNPDVISDALDAQQAKQTAQQDAQSAAYIRAHRAEIFDDAMSPAMGSRNGDVVVAEFFDFRCPYCKNAAPMVESLLRKDPRVRIVLKNLPILGPESEYAARLGYAAAKQGRFAQFYTTLFAFVPPDGDRASIDHAVRSMGLDPVALYRESKTKDVDASLQRDSKIATALGITGTPAFVVGEKLIVGVPDRSDLLAADP